MNQIANLVRAHFIPSLLGLHALLLLVVTWNHSPNVDEVGHLTAGLFIWDTGEYWLYRVNPPLVKMVASLPAALGDLERDWDSAAWSTTARYEWRVGGEFLKNNGESGFYAHRAGRILCLVFPLVAGLMIYWWGARLHNQRAGVIAWMMWIVSPTALAWGTNFSPDAGAAAMMLAASAAIYHLLKHASHARAGVAGVVAGLALLTKFTAILLIPVWLAAWLGQMVFYRESSESRSSIASFTQVAIAALVALFVVNLGYNFDRTCRPLGEFTFSSYALSGNDADPDRERHPPGNVFVGTIFESMPVPLPAELLYGIDTQKIDFENGMSSYLMGEWKTPGGWWYYYVICLWVKTPVGTLLLGGAGLFLAAALALKGKLASLDWTGPFIFYGGAIAVFSFVSLQVGFSRYYRYVLPCLPAFLVCAAVASDWLLSRKLVAAKVAATLLLLVAVGESLSSLPSPTSFFNAIAGGTRGGPRYVIDSNVDFAQDFFRLKHWSERCAEAAEMPVLAMGFLRANVFGFKDFRPSDELREGQLFAVSRHELYCHDELKRYREEEEPVAMVGSFDVYRYKTTIDGGSNM